jgi:PKD repeat protein
MKKTLILLFSLIIRISSFAQADAGPDQTACGETFILDGSTPINGTGIWSISSGGATISNPTLSATEVIIPQGETILRWTTNDDFGVTYDEISLTYNSPPKADFIAYPENQVYPGATINFDNYSGENYDKYYWDFGDGSYKIDNEFDGTDDHMYSTWGKYEITLIVSSGSCKDTSKQLITIQDPEPRDNGGAHYTGCLPSSGRLRANVDYAYTYHWEINSIHEGLIMIFDEENPTFFIEGPGTYYAALSVAGADGNMFKIRTDTITVYPVPIAAFNFEPESPIELNQNVQFENNTDFGDFYEWDFGDGSNISTEKNPYHAYTNNGTYDVTLRVYTENECFAMTEKSIEVGSGTLKVEELNKNGIKISPNPTNGKFFIEFKNSTKMETIKIRNINGQLLVNKKIKSKKELIDLSSFGKGVYMITLNGESAPVRHKIIVLD